MNDHDRFRGNSVTFLLSIESPPLRVSIRFALPCILCVTVRTCFDSGGPTIIRRNDPLERTKTEENGGGGGSVREFGGSLDASEREREKERDIATTGFILVLHKFLLNGERTSRRPPSYPTCFFSSSFFPSSTLFFSPSFRLWKNLSANQLANS